MKHLNFSKSMPLASLALLLFVTGCKKNITNPENPSEKNKTEVNSGGDGIFDVLGYGYNVTGKFASLSSTQAQVLDMDKIKANNPQNIGKDDGTGYSAQMGPPNGAMYPTKFGVGTCRY
ncbi:hypothetical protein H7F33_11335 [Pedobacter sp. PAMC26386]|nr:hypothetical protein H7F33_11335 [Pedobacter sp. PAMC26386]